MDISTLERDRFDAMISVDANRLDRLLSKYLTYTHSTAVVDTKEVFIQKIISGQLKYRNISTVINQTYMNSTVMVAHYLLTMDVEVAGELKKVSSQAVSVWIDTENTWKLVVFHSTAVPLSNS